MVSGLARRAEELMAERVPFVQAVVVRAQVPSAAHPGDGAIILADGSIEGFVGGQCAEGSVRTAALGALRDGRTTLLRILPEDELGFPETPGAQVVVNPCLSGGALEIFLQPLLPPPVLWIVGESPIAQSLAELARLLDFAVRSSDDELGAKGATAVVVSTHGRGEEATIRAALDAGVGYVGLVASPRRGKAVLDELGLTAAERERVRSPAGLWIGARTPAEIALSILADIVGVLRLTPPDAKEPVEAPLTAPLTAIDPMCGMRVPVAADTPHLVVDGEDVWFCGTGCLDRHAKEAGR